MKKLDYDLFTKPLVLFSSLIIVMFLLSFLLSENFVQELIVSSNLDASLVMHSFYKLWLSIFFACVVAFLVLFLSLKNLKNKFNEELLHLTTYLNAISTNKKYDVHLKIKYYIEFLHISIVLKNIIKRLHNKDKKK